jgi:hypothetical protein
MKEPDRHVCLGFTDERYPAGTHICYLYSSDEERRRILPLYARQALLAQEAFNYVADVDSRAELPQVLEQLDLAAAIRERPAQTEVAISAEGYFPLGRFSPDDMIGRLRRAYEQCLAQGLSGARFAGEMTWALRGIPGTERILECESRINELVKEAPMTIMCQYDLNKFDGAMLYDVLNVHPVVIIGGHLLRNPFYQHYGRSHGHPGHA